MPSERVFAAEGVDVTLACNIVGSPVPQARWVMNGRILNNNTSPQPFSDQTYLLRERAVTHDGVERWLNLTITSPSEQELGEYLCVAENNGGVAERGVTLTFDDPASYLAGGGMLGLTEEQLTILVGAAVAVLLLALLVLVVCCCCICRRGDKVRGKILIVATTETRCRMQILR